MKLRRLTCCFLLLLTSVLWQCPLFGFIGLSPKKVKKFTNGVRQNLEHGNLNFRVKVRLYEPLKSDSQKFGEIFYTSSPKKQKFRVTFGDKEYKFSHYKGQIAKGSSGKNLHINTPFFDDLLLTPQDLLLSFSWNDSYEYFGTAKVVGRPVRQFIRHEKDSANDEYTSIVASVDIKSMMILQIDFLNDISISVRRLSVGSFKNFDGIWMPKLVEITDTKGHRRAKLEILSVETKS